MKNPICPVCSGGSMPHLTTDNAHSHFQCQTCMSILSVRKDIKFVIPTTTKCQVYLGEVIKAMDLPVNLKVGDTFVTKFFSRSQTSRQFKVLHIQNSVYSSTLEKYIRIVRITHSD